MEGVMFPHSNANYQIESVELSVIRLADETLPVPDEQVHRDALMDAARKCMAGSELVLMENGKCVMTGFTLRVPGVAYSIHDQMVDDVYEAVIKATFADPPLLEAQTFVFSNDGVACSDIVDFKVEGIARAHPVAAVTRDGALNSHTKSLGVAALLLALAP
ncbi:hypothetical protein GNI_037390 [Gregarina niphandrodes]|uniref:Uncharacterized protein n=1 Tax=Gregarina niphandrodes TaxID=110365 RepID=A0A023BAM4_GRENI|nr:hypothetical protein GNI_037390 [Gregarina niphandrodes]EZG78375.1 hypothetical protein GNI_037390 [Gregarina niphandrodes]|eukprot:XP_011129330.1 hypothetical protein GNI_037390 [Gregarina niphandrodes]